MKKQLIFFVFALLAAGALWAEPHAFPVPYLPSRDGALMHFTELPADGTIKIFTITGDQVATINIPPSLGSVDWPVVTSEGKKLATGVYLYLIEGGGQKTDGKIIVIR